MDPRDITAASAGTSARDGSPARGAADPLSDVVVIGGGAAGLNGALMLARSRRRVIVVDAGNPRNAPAEGVHGLLGREGTPPAELLARGRDEVESYGGTIVQGRVASVRPDWSVDGVEGGFDLTLEDGRALRARRLLVATGVRDELPAIPGLARHWGSGVVHCPYCHGWEVRDEPIGILASGPMSAHQAWLFRQLSDDIAFFARGTALDARTRARMSARGIRVIDEEVAEVIADDGTDPDASAVEGERAPRIAGVRLASGEVIARRVLAVATTMTPRLDGLEGLGLRVEEVPGMGAKVPSAMAGVSEVPGVWVAGNVTDPTAQVGAAAAAGALAGAHINADLATADTDAALRSRTVGEAADGSLSLLA
ncbi:NAD(P)/FAD-dependent oxidoreductase [Brachybacterium halotolerans subsp. kimchii]|uniref:NAD(P)/FAD-dependent oxidoreductase n=1 Tax=Brachybacterium halotolerans TaxID=2795215 RepID=UPI001E54237C|nr:NAD(P)/FAD-dependent oxidoreductase [Brachybacterium halotolerans]UEJ83868.1 NAD(P)/FAD-dependent oxidoreductase [Brachybacterium halotolerans subsp. kimchii]